MDIREFTDKFADATRNMSPEQREALVKMLESVSGDLPVSYTHLTLPTIA